jgi:trimeric autotransporter adhesin
MRPFRPALRPGFLAAGLLLLLGTPAGGDHWDDSNIGPYSMATGFNTTASGSASTAIGANTMASYEYSSAFGYATAASGFAAISMGGSTTASGAYSTAIGVETTASGHYSTAMGSGTRASGAQSTAMGRRASTHGFTGSFVYGDAAGPTTDTVRASAHNQATWRTTGGFRIFTNTGLTTWCLIAAGWTAWTCTSSRLEKAESVARVADPNEKGARSTALRLRNRAPGATLRRRPCGACAPA